MRKDMSKVIVECYREGRGQAMGYRKHRSELNRMGEEAPRHESMQKIYKAWGCDKSPGEKLSPLRRYLKSQVGRPWDKVRSEMSQHMDRNSTMQAHIWQHAVHYVETNTFIGKDGKVWFNAKRSIYFEPQGIGAVRPISAAHAIVYVHPNSGCLKLVPDAFKSAKIIPYRGVIIDKSHQAHRIKGIWFIITLAPIPAKVYREFRDWEKKAPGETRDGEWITPRYYDVAIWAIVGGPETSYDRRRSVPPRGSAERYYGSPDVYAVHKKQCNSKELRRHGLENETADATESKRSADRS